MATISVPNTFSANTTISSSEVNSNFSTIYNEFNGSIDAANLATDSVTTAKIANDAVTTTKINDSAVTTAKFAGGGISNSDLLTTAGELGGEWDTWSPGYGNVTVGNGTVTARYTQIGKTVHFIWKLVCGSTTSIGSGTGFDAPLTAASHYATAKTAMGSAISVDVGSANYLGWASFDASATRITVYWNDGTSTGSVTFPFTETTNDTVTVTGTYEAA